MTAVLAVGEPAIAARHAAIILRCRAILTRARESAWQAGGAHVIQAIALLDVTLRAYDRDRDDLGVHTAEAAAGNLIIIIRRECGDDEARRIAEGDE